MFELRATRDASPALVPDGAIATAVAIVIAIAVVAALAWPVMVVSPEERDATVRAWSERASPGNSADGPRR